MSTDLPVYVSGPSYTVIPRSVREVLRTDHRAIAVWLELASYADSSGDCWPSRARISGDLGISVDTLDRTVRRMVDLGVMTVTRGGMAPGGRRVANTYHLTTPGAAPMRPAGPHPCGQRGRTHAAPTITSELTPVETERVRAPADEVWDAWLSTLTPERRVVERRSPTAQARAKVQARLRDGMTVDDLIAAVQAWPLDTWADRPQHCTPDVLLATEARARRWLAVSSGTVRRTARYGPDAARAAMRALQAETQPMNGGGGE